MHIRRFPYGSIFGPYRRSPSAAHTLIIPAGRTNLDVVLHPLVFQLLVQLIGKRTLMRFAADRVELLQ